MAGIELASGEVIAARYRLDRELGRGGMGVVWAAERLDSKEVVALKFVKEAASDPSQFRRLLREARAACAIHHPNVVQVHEVLELEGGVPALVMEVLHGESLAARLNREGEMDLEATARLMLPVIAAVGTAHSLGIVHRDLKPENIFLAKTAGGDEEVKVLDFGIAKLTAIDDASLETAGLTGTGALIGTPYYMAPEQIFGENDVDHRADIWALGLVLYRCLSGLLPTERPNVGQVLKVILTRAIWPLADAAPNLPSDVTDLVDRMLAKEREDRPADLTEVKKVLGRYAPGLEVAPFEHARISRTLRPTARAPTRPVARKAEPRKGRGVALALALGGALGLVFSLATLQNDPKLARDDEPRIERAPVRSEPGVPATEPSAVEEPRPLAPPPAPSPVAPKVRQSKPPKAPGPVEPVESVESRTPRVVAKPTPDELLDRRR